MMVVDPAAVASTIASIIDFVPFAKFSNSKTPGGLPTSTIVNTVVMKQTQNDTTMSK